MSDPDRLADAEYETLRVDVGGEADRVATVAISRPDARNALNATVRSELMAAVPLAEADDAVRVLVITGDDEGRAFVAGADITEFADRDGLEQRRISERPRIYETIADASIPVIARVNGHALGGGCELAQACDVRIAHERAKIGQPEINLGIMPGGGGTQRLPRLVGTGQAMKLALSGELIDATEAADIGLVEEVHGDGTFDERVYELAGTIAEKSPVALEFTKRAVQASARMPMDGGIDYEAELFTTLFDTEDKREGIAAFFEDREPEFEGR
ncbi:3-hydroxybutyryl-CoA dehydratase [Halorubrum sp. JWXQ-INN 858]|uniref:enoyl-CoA hydratase/isomerase family protein n=1 Tax=Halorubrum sp. JWXQ-INN 858 TaxID=2690782 RepID=UPI0013FC569D|nr:enoyl-CoA hydratase-related protein [Halorubrum sp. JWXQ-INN 858]MWV64546.1 3-hydroxybutyryl-CoA dehydratase [Halorubrum sp. JWXQ-INN 858]